MKSSLRKDRARGSRVMSVLALGLPTSTSVRPEDFDDILDVDDELWDFRTDRGILEDDDEFLEFRADRGGLALCIASLEYAISNSLAS